MDNVVIIHEEGPETPDDELIQIVDKALKEGGDLGAYGDLSYGLEELTKDSRITITETTEEIYVDMAPTSGGGHDFSFDINKSTGKMDPNSVCIGEIEEEEED